MSATILRGKVVDRGPKRRVGTTSRANLDRSAANSQAPMGIDFRADEAKATEARRDRPNR